MRMVLAATLAALLGLAAPGQAQQATAPAASPSPAPMPGYGPPVSLDMARKAVEAAVMAAQQRNLQMAVAVVDPAGTLVAFARVDGTQTASVQVAIDKARSAATYRRATKAFEDALVGGRQAILALPGAMPVEGGVPLLTDNRIVGAIGVSGGTAQEDGQIAAAGLAALR